MNLHRSVAPTSEPLTTTEAKAHLRVTISDDNTLIDALVVAAREYVEDVCSVAIFTQTWQLWLDGWPQGNALRLPRPPLQTVSSVKYYDAADTEYTLASTEYMVDATSWPARLVLRDAASWPGVTLRPVNGVLVTFVAGWSTTAAIPQALKQAMLLLLGHWYENREAVLTSGMAPLALKLAVESLLRSYRVRWEYDHAGG